jgi:hypothetical protein
VPDPSTDRSALPTETTSPAPRRFRRVLTGVTVTALAAGALSGAAAAMDRSADQPDAAAAALAAAERRTPGTVDLDDRGSTTSRSASRGPVDPAKAALVLRATRSGGQVTRTEDLGGGDPKAIAQAMLGQFGFGSDQWSCLESLWEKESGWDPTADNPTSSAYGIPQSLPGSKMASAGADWATNPATQIEWGLGYIRDTYGSPCSAWGHSQANNWY